MVESVKTIKKAPEYTSKLLLSSIKDFKPEGVAATIKEVSEPFTDNYNNLTIAVTISLMDPMPQMRAQCVGKDGEVLTVYDEVTGQKVKKFELRENVEGLDVPFYFNLTMDEESDPESPKFFISTGSKFYYLINYAFINAGELPQGHKDNIKATYDEIKEALNDCVFLACAKPDEYKGIIYNKLWPKPLYTTEKVGA